MQGQRAGRVCGVCSGSVPPGRRLYCGDGCASKVQQQQLEKLSERRKANRVLGKTIKCEIPECTNTFVKTSSRHKYCGTTCADKGLQMAIERQRQRREEAKKARVQK